MNQKQILVQLIAVIERARVLLPLPNSPWAWIKAIPDLWRLKTELIELFFQISHYSDLLKKVPEMKAAIDKARQGDLNDLEALFGNPHDQPAH